MAQAKKLAPGLRRHGGPRFGANMSIAGGCDRAVWAAHAVSFTAVQLFTKNSNQWQARELTDDEVSTFRRTLRAARQRYPTAHDSYLINLASPDETLWQKSIAAMVDEVERCVKLGITDLVVHPGAHMGQGEEAGV